MTSILSFLSGLCSVIGEYCRLRLTPNAQRRQAEHDIADRDAELKAKTDQIKEAVYTANDARLNEIVIGLLAPVIVFALMILSGCSSPKVVYVPTDRRITSITNSYGVACKAVPDAVFVEMLEKIVELQSLKTEQAVDHRLSTPAK